MKRQTGPKYLLHPTTALLVSMLLFSCATNDPDRRAKQGAAVGAIAGAVIGHQIDHDSGAIVGAAIGGMAGASIGHYQDQQQREMEALLLLERQNKQIDIQRLQDETLKVSLSSSASFDFDKATLKPAFYPTLNKLASLMVKYNRTILHVIGHTDDIGTEAYNLMLSNERANAVSVYLGAQGISPRRIRTDGRGESEPRLPNNTTENRKLNRRVEIFIKPIIQGNESEALMAPAPS